MTGHLEALERLRSANPLPGIEHVDADELALFLSTFEERRSPMTTTDERQTKRLVREPRQRLRPVLVFGLALAVVVAVIGGIAVVLSGGEGTPVATIPPDPAPTIPAPTAAPVEPTVAPDPTTAPSPTVPTTVLEAPTPPTTLPQPPPAPTDVELDWTRIDLGPGEPRPDVGIDDSLVALGRVVSEDQAFAEVGLEADWLAQGLPGYVALSHNSFSDGESEWGYHIVAFHSPDGDAWMRLPYDEAVFGGEFGWIDVRGLVYGDAGYVAVGVTDSQDGQNGIVWHSPDGVAWTRIPNLENMFGGPDGPSTWIEMEAVAYGNGTYVIIGVGPPEPAIWTSTNGVDWQLSLHSEETDELVSFSDLAYGEPGFLLVGSVLEMRPIFEGTNEEGRTAPLTPVDDYAAAWTSPDGKVWTRVPHDDELFGTPGPQEDLRMFSVIYGDGVFLVETAYGDEGSGVVVWTAG